MTRNDDDKVRKDAQRWFAKRLEPSARETERETFERWRGGDPRRTNAYAETERLWDKLEALKESARLRQALTDAASTGGFWRRAWRHPMLRYSVFAGLAASFVLVVVLKFVRFGQDDQASTQTFATALGEQRSEMLVDGTNLRLNTQSIVDVRMSHHRREITLRTGEAAFAVAKDASRPFVVSAADGTVTAVGTQFQVRNVAGAVAVTLMEGRVQVARASRREFESLSPGQQASFSQSASGIVTRNIDVEASTSWMSGRLEFRGTPLQAAVTEANRYSARKIRIGDPAIAVLPVSGTFRTGDMDGMAAAFEAAFAVRAESSGKEIVLYGR
jgi:transmembrane sensor